MSGERRTPGLVRTAVRLRWALLRGSLRSGPGSTARRFGLALGAFVGFMLAAYAFIGLTLLRGHGRRPEDLAVILFTALLLGWVVLPILTFSSDDLLDPAKLALLPLTGRQLVTVMGAGALVGVAPVATFVAALGLLPATGTTAASYLVALLSVVLELALCLSASRTVVSALSGLLRSRRGRDLGVAFAALIGLTFQLVNPLVQVAMRSGGPGGGALHGLAGPLRWTPSGILAAAPGRPLPAAVGSLLLVAALIGVLLLLWQRSVRRSLERAEVSGRKRRRSTTLAPWGLPLPAGRVGAVMAKDLRYLTREPRRMVAAVTSALLPVLAVLLGPIALSAGRPKPALVFAVCGLGLLSGLNGGNRFGLDGTATWMLVSSATDPLDARRDLLGGDLAGAVVIIPAMLVSSVVIAAITGGWAYVPLALGVGVALYAVGLGISGLLSVQAPYIVPQTQNTFGGGASSQGCTASLLALVAMVAEILLCLPLLGLLIPALLYSDSTLSSSLWAIVLLIAGPIYGILVGGVIRRIAARRWSERGPEVLQILTPGAR